MGKVYLTSDLHIGHTNIIYHCRRPFPDKESHDETIISNYNSLVGKDDHVYLLGDITFKGYEETISRLNGHKHIILGNHDVKKKWYGLMSKPELQIVRVVDTHLLKYNGEHIWLSHYPHRSWKNSSHGAYHAYGHCHGTMPPYNRSGDVGVDCNKFFPVLVDDFIEKLKDQPLYDERGR